MNRVEEMMDLMKAHDLRELKEFFNKKEEEQKKNNTLVWVFAIIGIVAAVAGIAFLVYRYFTPDYLEDYDDDVVPPWAMRLRVEEEEFLGNTSF